MTALNGSICSQPVAFFLGAGSSVPLGMPTTLSFRKTLEAQSDKAQKAQIKSLFTSAAYRYRMSEDSIDLETFLEFLHELRLGLWLVARSNISDVISPEIAQLDGDAFAEADRKVNGIRWKILEVLHSACGDCPGAKVDELWGPLLSELSKHSTVFPIFTVNYDWAFEKLCITSEDRYSLTDGFSGTLGGHWGEEHFTRFTPSADKIDICLFKLHGSTCWVGDIKSLGPFPEPEDPAQYGFETEDHSPFEIVYPGFRREVWLGKESWSMPNVDDTYVPWIEREPYSVLYRYLDCSLGNARALIVVGYAFGDKLVNGKIANAMAENKDLHVFVLDPGRKWKRRVGNDSFAVVHEPPYQSSLDFQDLDPEPWNNRLHWLPYRFGTKKGTKELLKAVGKVMA